MLSNLEGITESLMNNVSSMEITGIGDYGIKTPQLKMFASWPHLDPRWQAARRMFYPHITSKHCGSTNDSNNNMFAHTFH